MPAENNVEVVFSAEAGVRYWILIKIQDAPPIYEEVVMPRKTTNTTANQQLPEVQVEVRERRSPIPFNSFEAGCVVRMPSTSTNLNTVMDQALEIAEDGLDRARAMLEIRLQSDIDDGRIRE